MCIKTPFLKPFLTRIKDSTGFSELIRVIICWLCLSYFSSRVFFPGIRKKKQGFPNRAGKHDSVAWTVGIRPWADKGQSPSQLCVDKRIVDVCVCVWERKSRGQPAKIQAAVIRGRISMKVVRLSGKPAGSNFFESLQQQADILHSLLLWQKYASLSASRSRALLICSKCNISSYIHNYSPSQDSTVCPGCPTGWLSVRFLLKDALWSHISCCTAKDPLPSFLTPAFSNISWFSPEVEEGGSGTTQLQWLAGLLWRSHAGSRSTMTPKQTCQEKQRLVGEITSVMHWMISPPVDCKKAAAASEGWFKWMTNSDQNQKVTLLKSGHFHRLNLS